MNCTKMINGLHDDVYDSEVNIDDFQFMANIVIAKKGRPAL